MRTYKGCLIEPYTGNTPYWRYQAYVEGCGWVYATTLRGIRGCISHALTLARLAN